jgi:hypothetical protein
MKFLIKKLNKKALELQMLGWWLLGIFVLIIVILVIIVLKGKGEGAIGFIRDLLRFKGG